MAAKTSWHRYTTKSRHCHPACAETVTIAAAVTNSFPLSFRAQTNDQENQRNWRHKQHGYFDQNVRQNIGAKSALYGEHCWAPCFQTIFCLRKPTKTRTHSVTTSDSWCIATFARSHKALCAGRLPVFGICCFVCIILPVSEFVVKDSHSGVARILLRAGGGVAQGFRSSWWHSHPEVKAIWRVRSAKTTNTTKVFCNSLPHSNSNQCFNMRDRPIRGTNKKRLQNFACIKLQGSTRSSAPCLAMPLDSYYE